MADPIRAFNNGRCINLCPVIEGHQPVLGVAAVEECIGRASRAVLAVFRPIFNEGRVGLSLANGGKAVMDDGKGIVAYAASGAAVGAAHAWYNGGLSILAGAFTGMVMGGVARSGCTFAAYCQRNQEQMAAALQRITEELPGDARTVCIQGVRKAAQRFGVSLHQELPPDEMGHPEQAVRYVQDGQWVVDPVVVRPPNGVYRVYSDARVDAPGNVVQDALGGVFVHMLNGEQGLGARRYESPLVKVASLYHEARVLRHMRNHVDAVGWDIAPMAGWFNVGQGRIDAFRAIIAGALEEVSVEANALAVGCMPHMNEIGQLRFGRLAHMTGQIVLFAATEPVDGLDL